MFVVSMTAAHLENCHGEIFQMFIFEFEDVFACFEVEDGDDCVSWTTFWIFNGLFR